MPHLCWIVLAAEAALAVGVSAASLVLARGAAATAASAAATARHARRAEDALTAWLPALSQVEIEHHETLLGRLAGR